MSATIKRKHLVLTGLVIALGTAMFVNWYYTCLLYTSPSPRD